MTYRRDQRRKLRRLVKKARRHPDGMEQGELKSLKRRTVGK